jgi:DNA-directed RNA polymerase specialized sigma24 family protein
LQRSCFILEGEVKATNVITDDELEEVFLEDPVFGLRLLHTDFRDRVARYISSRLYGIAPATRAEAVKEIYQDTMVALMELTKRQDFDWHKPLGIVFGIAFNLAATLLRRRKFVAKQDIDGAIEQIANDLAGTKIGREWRLQSRVEWDEFHCELLQAIDRVLTPKQGVVVRCYIDNYEDFGERDIYAPLARLVAEITGNDENAMTVKKQWLEARKRLVDELSRRGFKFLEIEE